jgi:hypothetical protein
MHSSAYQTVPMFNSVDSTKLELSREKKSAKKEPKLTKKMQFE